MTTSVEVFYSFQSPYSYLALESIYDLEDCFDIELLWHPFSARASGHQVAPTPIVAEKLSYVFEDCKRFAEEHHIPLVFPESWPELEFDPNRATRGAVVAKDMGILKEYNYKFFHKWWGLGENPNEDDFLNELCDELDVELSEFLSKLSTSDIRERVKGIYKRGRKLGVFDTPTLVIGNERFFGIDKISVVAERLNKLGLKK